jgi:hypothetical protein
MRHRFAGLSSWTKVSQIELGLGVPGVDGHSLRETRVRLREVSLASQKVAEANQASGCRKIATARS